MSGAGLRVMSEQWEEGGLPAERLHTPVLLEEVLEWLNPQPGKRYLDGTVGLGGHSQALLERTAGKAQLVGLDRDASALAKAEERLASFSECTAFVHTAYSRFEAVLQELGWDFVDGAMLDLGVSSMQLDSPERGFSFMSDGPLDMRMDVSGGQAPASRLVNKSSHKDLAYIIGHYGEEPMAGRIARAIVDARAKKQLETTLELASVVERAYPAKWRANAKNHPATRTFQALRMAVNQELNELETFIERIADYLSPGARVVVISFHSLEDRLVKRGFRAQAQGCQCPSRLPVCACGRTRRLEVLTKKPVTASEAEKQRNSRARSAKLRAAERVEDK